MERIRDDRSWLGWPRRGWRIVGGLAAGMLLLAAATVAAYGLDDAGLGLVARNAARISLVLFALAFSAAPLARFFPSGVTRRLLADRRYVGVSFAVSHVIFLTSHVVRVLAVYDGDFFALREPAAWIGGSVLYGFILSMAVTSFPAPAARLGPKYWKLLHTVGGYLIALTFANSYVVRALGDPFYLPAAAVALSVLGLRAAAFAHERIPPCRALLDACLNSRSR